jgi:hypothetical protein
MVWEMSVFGSFMNEKDFVIDGGIDGTMSSITISFIHFVHFIQANKTNTATKTPNTTITGEPQAPLTVLRRGLAGR